MPTDDGLDEEVKRTQEADEDTTGAAARHQAQERASEKNRGPRPRSQTSR